MQTQRSKVTLSPFAQEVADLIRNYSTLADAILNTQCKLAGCSVAGLVPEDLEVLIPPLRQAVERFTSPIKGERLEVGLRALMRDRLARRPKQITTRIEKRPSHKDPEPAPGTLAFRVLMVLGEHTPFGKQIYATQCDSIDADPENITPRELNRLIPKLSARVGQWTSPLKGRTVESQLRRLQPTSDK